MANFFIMKQVFFSLFITIVITGPVQASDPDILFNYIVPPNVTLVDGNFFTYTNIREFFNGSIDPTSMQASMVEFLTLNGQSVSLSVLRLAPGGVSPPHTRPHAIGLFLVLQGAFDVGLLDTSNKLYIQTLQTGDMFIFPKGLVHYQYNVDTKNSVVVVAGFGSASTALVLVPTTLFKADIDDVVLAESFRTDVETIQKLRTGLRGKL